MVYVVIQMYSIAIMYASGFTYVASGYMHVQCKFTYVAAIFWTWISGVNGYIIC